LLIVIDVYDVGALVRCEIRRIYTSASDYKIQALTYLFRTNMTASHLYHRSFRFVLACTAITLITSCSSTGGNYPKAAPTIVNDVSAAQALEGKRPISLQWISWDFFGIADIRKMGKTYWISGNQTSRVNSDFVKIHGRISQIDSLGFTLDGTVTTKVYHINQGREVVRQGPLRFQLYGNRRFWRMTQMRNPFGTIDYVDIYFDLAAAQASPSGGTL